MDIKWISLICIIISIKKKASKQSITPRNAFFVLIKEEKEKEYWPRLLEAKGKVHYLKTDFGRWKDEDDDDDVPNPMEGLDFSQVNKKKIKIFFHKLKYNNIII